MLTFKKNIWNSNHQSFCLTQQSLSSNYFELATHLGKIQLYQGHQNHCNRVIKNYNCHASMIFDYSANGWIRVRGRHRNRILNLVTLLPNQAVDIWGNGGSSLIAAFSGVSSTFLKHFLLFKHVGFFLGILVQCFLASNSFVDSCVLVYPFFVSHLKDSSSFLALDSYIYQ